LRHGAHHDFADIDIAASGRLIFRATIYGRPGGVARLVVDVSPDAVIKVAH
jgi:hypothetical protein